MNEKQTNVQSVSQFINQDVRVFLTDSTTADKIGGKLCAVDQLGIVLTETTERANQPAGVFFYPWSAIRYVHLSENVSAFRAVA